MHQSRGKNNLTFQNYQKGKEDTILTLISHAQYKVTSHFNFRNDLLSIH